MVRNRDGTLIFNEISNQVILLDLLLD